MTIKDQRCDPRPNVLLFLPDGMPAEALRPGGDCMTPNFDRLASRGLRFNRAYTALPTCSPSRASLMTGMLPHNHGVLQVEHCVDDDQCVLRLEYPHWAQRLVDAGYHTGYFGKWHIERTNRLEDFGWQVNGCDESAAQRGVGSGEEGAEALLNEDSFASYVTTPPGYNPVLHYGVTDVPTSERRFARTTANALEFIGEASSSDEPWACCVSFSEPNTPVIAGREAFERYDVDAIRLPESLRDPLTDRPALYRRAQQVFAHIADRQWREVRAVYFALVTELDEQFGRLLDKLEQTGQLDNTIVIVASDHGRYLGAHGFDNHNFAAFEEAYHVPLIMAGPGIAQGEQTDGVVSLRDLCPTLVELTNAEPMEGLDARSFVPLLAEPQTRADEFNTAYAEFHGTRFVLTQRVLWEGPWKFVFNGFDDDELYNLDEDPHEVRNLAHDPAHEDTVRRMMTGVWRRISESNDRALLGTHYLPMRFAVIGPNAGAEKT